MNISIQPAVYLFVLSALVAYYCLRQQNLLPNKSVRLWSYSAPHVSLTTVEHHPASPSCPSMALELLEALSRHCTQSEVNSGIHRSIHPEMMWLPSRMRTVEDCGNLPMPTTDFPHLEMSVVGGLWQPHQDQPGLPWCVPSTTEPWWRRRRSEQLNVCFNLSSSNYFFLMFQDVSRTIL